MCPPPQRVQKGPWLLGTRSYTSVLKILCLSQTHRSHGLRCTKVLKGELFTPREQRCMSVAPLPLHQAYWASELRSPGEPLASQLHRGIWLWVWLRESKEKVHLVKPSLLLSFSRKYIHISFRTESFLKFHLKKKICTIKNIWVPKLNSLSTVCCSQLCILLTQRAWSYLRQTPLAVQTVGLAYVNDNSQTLQTPFP